MKQPRQPSEYPARFGDCERAVGGEALLLVERAIESGWSEREAVVALADCALKYLQQIQMEDAAAVQIGALAPHPH
jgi:hypothetical protein